MQDDKTLTDFYKLTRTEDYFKFFDISFDKRLINAKRLHILKQYGTLIKKGISNITDESQLLSFLKFSLLRVYGDYINGNHPSAADVWNMYETGKLNGCASCAPSGGNCGC